MQRHGDLILLLRYALSVQYWRFEARSTTRKLYLWLFVLIRIGVVSPAGMPRSYWPHPERNQILLFWSKIA